MKKLIICVAAVLSACALNAATVNWGMTDLFDDNYESLVGTLTLASGSFTSTGTISNGETSGTFTDVTWGTDPFSTGAAWTMTARIQDVNGDMYEQVFNVTLGTITDDARNNEAEFYNITTALQAEMLPNMTLDTTDMANAGWSAVGGGGGGGGTGGVPEPTSGLLLVLGGAMLALRRRR